MLIDLGIYATLGYMHQCRVKLSALQEEDISLDKRTSHQPAASGRRTFSWFLLIVANVLWAGSYVAAKYALLDLSVNMMNALRMIIAALVLLPLLFARRGQLRLSQRDLLQLALLALIGFVINKILEYGGLALTTASDVALLIASESIFTAILSWIILRERFRLLNWLALLLGLAGVYLIIERSLLPNIPAGGGAWRIAGDLLVIGALIFEALFTVRGKSLLVKHSPLLVTAAALVGSTVFWVPMAGYQLVAHGWPALGWQSWLGLLWLALMSTSVAYLAWFKGLERLEGGSAAITLFIQPLLGATLAIVLLGDQLLPTTIIGGGLILVSVYLIARNSKTDPS
ncbi:MAG TPA: DMT family transporter [Ktedonobacteraceae bacterium]